jgi:hypothetical protein
MTQIIIKKKLNYREQKPIYKDFCEYQSVLFANPVNKNKRTEYKEYGINTLIEILLVPMCLSMAIYDKFSNH